MNINPRFNEEFAAEKLKTAEADMAHAMRLGPHCVTQAAAPSAGPGSGPGSGAMAHGTGTGGSKDSALLIYDGKSHSDPRIEESVATAEQATLLSKVFPKYLKDAKQCSGNSTDLADARRRGDIVPTVRSAATGAFTAAGRTQKLYLVSIAECGASHADNFGSNMIVVTEADNVRARIGIEGGTLIHALVDLEGDGRLEVVLTSGFMGQGTLIESASLVRVGPSDLTTIKDFGQVMEANCASASDSTKEDFSVIHAVSKAGSPLEFRIEKKSRPCD